MQFRARRIQLDLPVELTFSGSRETVSARTRNVSETGMLVQSTVHRPPGTGVRFEVPPRYGGVGRVAWTRVEDAGAALMGLSLGRNSRQTLMDLLDEQFR